MLMFFHLAANSRSEFRPERLAAIAQTTSRALDAGIKRIEVDMEQVWSSKTKVTLGT